MRRVQHRARAQEEQALEHRVIQAVVEHRGQRESRERMHLVGVEHDREAERDDDKADILDRRIGEQPLHIDLHRGEDDAEERRGEPDRQRHHAPPPQRRAHEVEGNAHHAVDRGLQHHAAHQRRDRRRSGGVRFGKPHVQRQDAGLGAEAEEREEKRGRSPERRQVLRAHVGKGVVARVRLQHAEAQQDGDRADVRDQQVEVARALDFGNAMVGRHEEERRQRHHLPVHHERVGVVRKQHQRHRREEDVVLQADQPGRGALALAKVPAREDRDTGARHAQQHEEECRERIEAQVERQAGKADREHRDLRRIGQGRQRQPGEHEAHERGKGKKQPRDDAEIAKRGDSRESEGKPGCYDDQYSVDREQLRGHTVSTVALR